MKKKEIEKIPFRGGVRADKQYRNTAVVFLQDIRGESHLFVEVYENKKRELQTPWIRMVFTQKDWGLYYPDARVWSAAGLDEEREKIDSNCKKRDNRCYMARSQGDMVWKFTGDTWERKYTTWVGALQSLIYNIKAQRVQKREDKRADRLKEREQNTPPLPKGLEDWAKKTGIGTEHFLYYKRHGRYADITCSACGQVTEAAVRRKDTYEGQFEKIIPVPQHDSVGTCPHCGAAGVYKAQGKVKGVWGHGMNCFIAQRYKDDGAVIRYVEIEKIYRLDTFLDEKEIMIGAGEKMIITEIARTYLEKGKRPQTDYHKFSSYSGEFWDDCNLCGMNNISIKAAKIYPESYKELRTTFLRYSAAEMYGKHKTMYNLKEYLERYIQWPQIEMFVKMGLHHIAESIVEGYCGIIADKDAIKPECFLGIYKRRLRDLKTLQGNLDYLKMWQLEKRMGLHLTVQESVFLAESQVRQNDLEEILKYTTVAKFMHRIEQYSGCEIPDTMQEPMCGRAAGAVSGVTRTYVDYLHMRIQRGYDLHNQIFLFPRDLRLAHDQMVIETNAEEIRKREQAVSEKYPDIRKNYRGLRNQYIYEDEDYLIRPARSAEEIVAEGRILHHCVGGDSYLNKHNTGRSTILYRKGTVYLMFYEETKGIMVKVFGETPVDITYRYFLDVVHSLFDEYDAGAHTWEKCFGVLPDEGTTAQKQEEPVEPKMPEHSGKNIGNVHGDISAEKVMEKPEIAPAQQEEQIPGQDSIDQHPEYMPEPVQEPDIPKKPEDSVPGIHKEEQKSDPVPENNETIPEAIPEKAITRKEYLETLTPYGWADYVAAAMRTFGSIPFSRLREISFWEEWLCGKVDKKGRPWIE